MQKKSLLKVSSPNPSSSKTLHLTLIDTLCKTFWRQFSQIYSQYFFLESGKILNFRNHCFKISGHAYCLKKHDTNWHIFLWQFHFISIETDQRFLKFSQKFLNTYLSFAKVYHVEILVHLSKLSQIHVLKANLFPKEIPFYQMSILLFNVLFCFP